MVGLQRNQTLLVGSQLQIKRGLAGLGCTPVMDNRTSRGLQVGWVGLGKMGFHMAGHVTRKVLAENGEIRVYNRSVDKAQAHARQFGSMPVNSLQELSGCDVVFSCLATTAQVDEASAQVSNAGVWVDCSALTQCIDADAAAAAFTEAAEDFLAMQVEGVAPSEALVQLAQASTAASPWLHVR